MQATTTRRLSTAASNPLWQTGDGRSVVLLHGVLVDHRMWWRQVEALATDYRVCTTDMLGHGEAPDPPGARVLADFVAQVADVVDACSGDGPPVLVGFSMGGLVAQAFAIEHWQRLAGLVLLNTIHDRSEAEATAVLARHQGNIDGGVEHAVANARERYYKLRDLETQPEVAERMSALMRDGDFTAKLKAHRVFVTSHGEVAGRLGAVRCPALVITGDEDGGSTPAMAARMARDLPDAELHVLDGQHHMAPVLDAPRVNGLLLDFLGRCFGKR